MEHMKKAFAITGLVLGISAMVAGATAVVFSCLGMALSPSAGRQSPNRPRSRMISSRFSVGCSASTNEKPLSDRSG